MFLFRLLPVFWVAAIVFGCIMVGHSTLAHQKRWKRCIIAAGLVLWTLSGLSVYIISFSSPEAAFAAMHTQADLPEEELLTLEGETSAWVIGVDSTQFIKKNGNRWKLAGVRDFSSSFYMAHADNITILVEGLGNSRDRYICVTMFPASEECRFDTPQGTVFYEKSDPETVQPEVRSRHFYAYIGSLETPYEFTLNGASFRIPKTADLGAPKPIWPQFLLLFCTLALLIVGSIGIIRIRGLSRAKKVLLIFLLLLFVRLRKPVI